MCLFCKIVNKEIESNIIFENDYVISILDPFPSSLGHILIIPKKHFENIFELEEVYANEIMKSAIIISNKMREVLKFDGLNIVQNNGETAGQSILHYHMHLIPRYKKDDVKIGWSIDKVTAEDLQTMKEKLMI